MKKRMLVTALALAALGAAAAGTVAQAREAETRGGDDGPNHGAVVVTHPALAHEPQPGDDRGKGPHEPQPGDDRGVDATPA